MGLCPSGHPFAVGIFSVMIRCGCASGTSGVLPIAGLSSLRPKRRIMIIMPPMTATSRA